MQVIPQLPIKTLCTKSVLCFIQALNPYELGLSQDLETGCPNRGFIDFCASKVWYKVHTTNEINPIY